MSGEPLSRQLSNMLADPQVVINSLIDMWALRVGDVNLHDAPPPFDFRVNQREQIAERAVEVFPLLERRHLILGGRLRITRQRDVTQVVVDAVYTVLVQDVDQSRQQVSSPTRTGR